MSYAGCLMSFYWYCYIILYFNQYWHRCCWHMSYAGCLMLSSRLWMLSWFDTHQALSCYLLLHGFSLVSWSCSDLEVPVIGCRCRSESLLCEDRILSDCLQLLIWIWYARVIFSVIASCCCYECLVCKEISSAIACHCWPWNIWYMHGLLLNVGKTSLCCK
jgi:hypothetical protein